MNILRNSYVCTACSRSVRQQWRRLSGERRAVVLRAVSQRRGFATHRDERPFRMAVIGSGPAGFYTAYRVMSRIPGAKIDMYEQLPIPYGLVRFGVAPDHPEVKNCQEKFEEVAQSPDFTFIGNVPIGSGPGALPLASLVPHYDAVLFSYGASKDKVLGVPGENTLSGIHSARAFVGWYNGLPEYAGFAPDLTRGEDAVVIGQGNVALDVARILLSPLDHLRRTDIAEHALEALSRSRVKHVHVVGRRGPLQAAFTTKEVRELMKLPSVSFKPIDSSLIPPDTLKLGRTPRRIMDLLVKHSASSLSYEKSWSLDFRLSPVKFNAPLTATDQLSSVTFEKTTLTPHPFEPAARAIGTGEMVDLPASLAFRSIGYKSEPLPGLSEVGVPFDPRVGIIPNDLQGRVIQPGGGDSSEGIGSPHVPGMYCAGWVKRGPTGVIASTMDDAFTTAEVIAQDWAAGLPFLNASNKALKQGWNGVKGEADKRGCRRVSWHDWKKIDEAERKKGNARGKEREKFTKVDDMLAILD